MKAAAESFSPMNLPGKSSPRTLAVTGGRAGLGKSCIVLNLGLALALLGKKVLLLDADLNHPGLASLLGLKPRHSIIDVLAGQQSLSEVITTGPGGLQVVPGSPDRPPSEELIQARKLLFLEEWDACTAALDFILVDAGAGVSENVLFPDLGFHARLVVADQEPASVIDAYRLIKTLGNRYSQQHFQLLFNRIKRPDEPQRSFEMMSKVAHRFLPGKLSLHLLGFIPEDEALPKSVGLQKLLVQADPLSPASLAFTEIARSLVFHPDLGADGNITSYRQNVNQRPADSCSRGDSLVSKSC